MALLSRALLLLSTFLLVGCSFLREPSPVELSGEEILVHSLLLAGSDTVSVYLTRTRPGTATSAPTIQPISAADVRITGPAVSMRLEETSPGSPQCFLEFAPPSPTQPGCYGATLPGGVQSGSGYELRIQLPGGGSVEGMAVIPQPMTLLAPQPEAQVLIRPPDASRPELLGFAFVLTRWSRPGDTGRVQFDAQSLAVFQNEVRVPNASCRLDVSAFSNREVESVDARATDSAHVVIRVINCVENILSPTPRQLDPDSVQARFRVTAFDTAYTRYAEALSKNSVARSQLSAGVRGALGVFAGAAVTERRIMLVLNRR